MASPSHAPRGRLTSYDSILHKAVHDRLEAAAVEHAIQLGKGSAMKPAAADTAAAYHQTVGYIRALRDCQQMCEDEAQALIRAG